MNLSQNQKIAIVVTVVVFIIAIIIWLKPVAKDGAPGAVTNITAAPASDKPANPSPYIDTPVEPGLLINFKTPTTTGVTGDSTFLEYMITLRDTTGDQTKSYLLDQGYFTGKTDGKNYTWHDTNNGVQAGSSASIFIKKSGIATLTDQHSYIVGIKAVNKNGVASPTETLSDPIKYDSCAEGENGACNWGSVTGVGSVTIISKPLPISTVDAPSASMIGSKASGAPCKGSDDNTLYSYNADGVCLPSSCKDKTFALVGSTCVKQAQVGDYCNQKDGTLSADKTEYSYFVNKDSSKELICDNTLKPTDSRSTVAPAAVSTCEQITGKSLGPYSKFAPTPGCAITCIDDKITGSIGYGPAPACQAVCDNFHWGSACTGLVASLKPNEPTEYLPIPPSTSFTYAGGMNIPPPTYYSPPYIFGKTNGTIGLYKDTGNGYIAQVWDLGADGVFSVDTNGTVTLGTKVFTPPPGSLVNMPKLFKVFRITSDGNLVIKYYFMAVNVTVVTLYMTITPDMVNAHGNGQTLTLTT